MSKYIKGWLRIVYFGKIHYASTRHVIHAGYGHTTKDWEHRQFYTFFLLHLYCQMSSNGKRDVLRSLDYLLYCHIAYTYFLDTSLLVLFFRILLQLVSIAHFKLNTHRDTHLSF